MTAPTRLNSGNNRPVTTFEVLNAENPQVEREQLNRILKAMSEQITALTSRVSALENAQ